jgi:magnesium transporter
MLVNSIVYQDGCKLGDIDKSEISDYVAKNDCFVWVALKDPDDAELEEMQREFNLHPLAVEDARHGHQRPKIEEYGDCLFAVVHTIETEGEDLEQGEVDIFVGKNYVLSVRNHTTKGFSDVRARCEREPELLRIGAGFVFYALIDAMVDRYFPVRDMLEGRLERVEQQIFRGQNSARENIESLYALKQQLMTLKHAVDPLIESVGKLFGGRVPHVVTGTQDYFRDVYDHLIRVDQSIDGLREMVATAIQVNFALISLQENETTKRLAAYAALVAVPTMIAGIYGMNFQHMPELAWRFGYPLALGIMGTLDAYLFYRFRKSGWL